MQETADLSSGRLPDGSTDSSLTDCLLSDEERVRVTNKLTDMLTSICDYCHERLGNLLSASPSEKEKQANEISKPGEKESPPSWSEKASWLSERATTAQVCRLANMVDGFTETCEKICGKQSTALRSAFKVIFYLFLYSLNFELINFVISLFASFLLERSPLAKVSD